MSLSLIGKNYKDGIYNDDTNKFINHMRLIKYNCLLFNEHDSDIVECANQFNLIFENKLEEIQLMKGDKRSLKKEKSLLKKRKKELNEKNVKCKSGQTKRKMVHFSK